MFKEERAIYKMIAMFYLTTYMYSHFVILQKGYLIHHG